MNTADIFEMKHLRFDKYWTLRMIADRFGVSRWTVQRYLGKTGTGFRAAYIKNLMDKNSSLTNTELAEITGLTEGTISQYRNGERHAISGGNPKKGAKIEKLVSEKLTKLGIQNELMPYNHPYDIELKNGKRVDVKSAWQADKSPSRHQDSTIWRFRTRGKLNDTDFFVLVIVPQKEFFVVPVSDTPKGADSIFLSWPTLCNRSKYKKYHNRFDLLSQEL